MPRGPGNRREPRSHVLCIVSESHGDGSATTRQHDDDADGGAAQRQGEEPRQAGQRRLRGAAPAHPPRRHLVRYHDVIIVIGQQEAEQGGDAAAGRRLHPEAPGAAAAGREQQPARRRLDQVLRVLHDDDDDDVPVHGGRGLLVALTVTLSYASVCAAILLCLIFAELVVTHTISASQCQDGRRCCSFSAPAPAPRRQSAHHPRGGAAAGRRRGRRARGGPERGPAPGGAALRRGQRHFQALHQTEPGGGAGAAGQRLVQPGQLRPRLAHEGDGPRLAGRRVQLHLGQGRVAERGRLQRHHGGLVGAGGGRQLRAGQDVRGARGAAGGGAARVAGGGAGAAAGRRGARGPQHGRPRGGPRGRQPAGGGGGAAAHHGAGPRQTALRGRGPGAAPRRLRRRPRAGGPHQRGQPGPGAARGPPRLLPQRRRGDARLRARLLWHVQPWPLQRLLCRVRDPHRRLRGLRLRQLDTLRLVRGRRRLGAHGRGRLPGLGVLLPEDRGQSAIRPRLPQLKQLTT